MKSTSEIIKNLHKRFNELELRIEIHTRIQMEEEERNEMKDAKLTESFISDYQAQQREVIRLYAFIKELDFVDACKELFDLYRERGEK